MKVAEKFISINGEGTRAGELSVFVRFQGCNLRCSYCDTSWAYEADCPYEDMTADQIVKYVLSTGIYNVTLTGGEPLLAQGIAELIEKLLAQPQLRVEIETNGAVDLSPFCTPVRPVFTMDYKLPSSGWERAMKVENFAILEPQDTVKFVCGSQEDLQRAWDIIREYRLTDRCHGFLRPVVGSLERTIEPVPGGSTLGRSTRLG